ncbi:calcium-translocating P-type ATPase [Colletotrichum sublineola]|nr:calcium-translocating P-type ATPase [Colletotrichum sublineola]
MPRDNSPPKRSRAPTITLDTSAVQEQGEELHNTSSTPSSDNGDEVNNTLSVPTRKSRSQSWDSNNTTLAKCKTNDGTDKGSPTFQHPGSPKGYGANPDDALAPNPGEEASFRVDNNPFAFTPGQVSKLINPKSLDAFVALGGLVGLEKGLRTDRRAGLSLDESKLDGAVSFDEAVAAGKKLPSSSEAVPTNALQQEVDQHADGSGKGFDDRKRVFGQNLLPERKSLSLLQLAWIAMKDKVLILLSVAAVISLALGLYQTFGATHHGDDTAKLEWVEGVAIIVAITIVVVVGSLNDWQKERQFRKLNQKKEDRIVKVIRSGKPANLSVHEILVGDVMLLEQGDIIPVDGVFIDGHNVSCDESSATGESDLIKKVPADAVMKSLYEEEVNPKKLDPFIISGARVLDGVGTFLVTAVGQNSSHGKTMMSLRDDPGMTPLQLKLNILAGYIAKLGSGAGLLLLGVLTIEFLAHLPQNNASPEEKGQRFLQILITSITIIVVAVPEGLPLAVTLALAYATKRMTKENNLVRHLQSCETMGNATVICSDKTGTLTENVMTVVAGTMGTGKLRFIASDDRADDGEDEAHVHVTGEDKKTETELISEVSMLKLSSALDSEFRDLIKQSVAMNTTAFEAEENGKQVFVGTKTETALLDWARKCFALQQIAIERENCPIEQLFPFNSKRKAMGAVVRLPNKKYRFFVKGAPEILLGQCSRAVTDPTKPFGTAPMAAEQQDTIRHIISEYARRSLRTIALAYRDFEQWPPENARKEEGSQNIEFSSIFKNLTWLGVVGIQDPVRAGVPKAVDDCRVASVSVKMVTGDNIETARAIAKDCGILTEKGKVMEGIEFRRMDDRERVAIVRDLCVLARSSPEDKRILVKALRSLGEIVAVTGDGTNDAPALKSADVGFSMGITGTEVAKEASDIILMDDNFSSIVKAMAWGRAINDAVKKFLQFQITVNITAVVLTFVTAVGSESQEPVLNAVQLLWVNLIMDTFAALALATDPPTESILHRKPEAKTAALINTPMWKMIIGQSVYQLIVTLILHFARPAGINNYPETQRKTLVFNVFVFMQIFKLVNSRRIDNKLNIFEGITKNKLFTLMMAIMAGGQVLIVFVGGAAFKVAPLNGPQWGISIVLGFLSIPVGILIRLLPDAVFLAIVKPFAWCWSKIPRWPRKKKTGDEDAEALGGVKDALMEIRDDLAFLKRIKGGRISQISEVIMKPREYRERTRSRSGSRSSSRHNTTAMKAAMGMPGIVAASVGGLSPVDRPVSSESRPAEGRNELEVLPRT